MVFTLRPSNPRVSKKRCGPCTEQALKPGLVGGRVRHKVRGGTTQVL